MARKSAALLKSAKIKLSKSSTDFLKTVEAMKVPAGVEEHFDRYITRCHELEEQWARVDEIAKLVDKKGSNDPNWPAYLTAHNDLARAQSGAFHALDGLQYAIKHLHDKQGVPVDDIRATVIDSLAGRVDVLTFSVNAGLLGSSIAKVIRKDTSEESAGEPPFCEECV